MPNPLIHKDRRLSQSPSKWARGFACESLRPLIVCRGPIRKEAMDVFAEMGMSHVGILLSEKDSIVYPNALAPELRQSTPKHVHRVKDYTGASKEERLARIREIVQIANAHGYNAVFAGYGFMAEDESFVRAIEESGLRFIGPCARTVKEAGHKDVAKVTAIQQQVSVTPGVNDVTTRCLLQRYPDRDALLARAKAEGLSLPPKVLEGPGQTLEQLAGAVLEASYKKGIDLYSIEELCSEVERQAAAMFREHPNRRVRLKAIGGGGGKGQRILSAHEVRQAKGKVREILSEVKATGVGDDKNVLLELNVEETRHNEIQLIGNGDWCVTMGGRDCSLQMHEQKLLEVSVTQEGLRHAIKTARARSDEVQAQVLEQDLITLERMEAEAERFGKAVGLDSVSTFECIVDGARHYFMEVNTRIQVEHRVSELCYVLRFTNPSDPADSFEVDSIVELMALLAQHKEQLPRPNRIPRMNAAVEARLNATDCALSPHAGGVIDFWSDPIEGEIRDDQGICIHNPDTGQFVRYKLAGAYDSNIALLVTHGEDRADSYRRLHEILRVTKLHGPDLSTNLEFHYGLVSWFLHRNVWAKPSTRFVVPYLTLLGELAAESALIDAEKALHDLSAFHLRSAAGDEGAKKATAEVLARKETLVLRPIGQLLGDAHVLSGWLSANRRHYEIVGKKLRWTSNPVTVLAETYHFLNMNLRADLPAAHAIWDHDDRVLSQARTFYAQLEARIGNMPWLELVDRLARTEAPTGTDAALWQKIRSAHRGYQLGLELLGILPLIAERVGFFELKVKPDLSIHIPERLLDPAHQLAMKKVLVPPPATKSDEIVAHYGGMFYRREAPDRPPIVEVGQHFEAGEAIYIIEVMKMFNKVLAPFAGTLERVLVDGGEGVIVSKGQPLFKVVPDEMFVEEDAGELDRRRREATQGLLSGVLDE